MTRLAKTPMTFITDADELREFIKTNKEKEDYFDRLVESVISSKNEEE
jgi:hypothetical protein